MATTLLIARHGETDWNRERRWQGHADPPLNEQGRAQALSLAGQLAVDPPEAVYTSDLSRARETAEIVARQLGLPVSVDARLREVDVGEWSGLLWSEIENRFPEGAARRRAGETGWEQGEEFAAMGERVVAALLEIGAAHPGGRILVVAHGGPVVAAWLASGGAFEARPVVSNCHVLAMRVESERIARID